MLPRGARSEPWRLSALVGPDVTADVDLALKFNCRHWTESPDGHAVIDALELKASTVPEVQSAMSMMPAQITAYFEIPMACAIRRFSRTIARAGGRVKGRTGGVTDAAFPASGCGRAIHHARARCRACRSSSPPGCTIRFVASTVSPTPTERRAERCSGSLTRSSRRRLPRPPHLGARRAALVESRCRRFHFTDDASAIASITVPFAAVRAARATR